MSKKNFQYYAETPEDIIRLAIIDQVRNRGGFRHGDEGFSGFGTFELSDERKGSYTAYLNTDNTLRSCDIKWE